ncbi:unnamed protein product [Brassica napus]|uniref:(rape) hypothetical protein n=1 Tax=Brassica napus TaxID=3708 RepID=A0A816JRE6_BRANA|nr:unnamed protein product [Brassica napus]
MKPQRRQWRRRMDGSLVSSAKKSVTLGVLVCVHMCISEQIDSKIRNALLRIASGEPITKKGSRRSTNVRSTLSKPENYNDVAYYDNAYIDPLFVVKGAQAMVSRGNNGLRSCLVQLMDWIICNPAPEYVETGHLRNHSDAYSFGVVLYEIIMGRRTIKRMKILAE